MRLMGPLGTWNIIDIRLCLLLLRILFIQIRRIIGISNFDFVLVIFWTSIPLMNLLVIIFALCICVPWIRLYSRKLYIWFLRWNILTSWLLLVIFILFVTFLVLICLCPFILFVLPRSLVRLVYLILVIAFDSTGLSDRVDSLFMTLIL